MKTPSAVLTSETAGPIARLRSAAPSDQLLAPGHFIPILGRFRLWSQGVLRSSGFPISGLLELGDAKYAVAFETALRLEALGIRPAVTFLSSHPAPGRPLRNCLTEFSDQALIGELRRLGATPAVLIDASQACHAVLIGLRSDYRAVARYRPSQGRLTTPVVALVGDDDPDVTPDDMRPWGEVTAGPMTLHIFPGGHFYLIAQRDEVLRTATAHLADR